MLVPNLGWSCGRQEGISNSDFTSKELVKNNSVSIWDLFFISFFEKCWCVNSSKKKRFQVKDTFLADHFPVLSATNVKQLRKDRRLEG